MLEELLDKIDGFKKNPAMVIRYAVG